MCLFVFSTNTGPGELSFMAIAVIKRMGEKRTKRKTDPKMSMVLFMIS